MTIHCGDCGHIKAHWDNHNKCINCSHCSRESTCSTCSSWSNSVWILAENRRILAAKKKAMTARKKSQDPSISSEERKNKHGSTAAHGGTSWGKTHIGGNSLGTCTQGSTSPLATGQRSPGFPWPTHRPPASRPMEKTHPADRACLVTGHQSCPVTGHQPPDSHRPPYKWARKRLPAYQSPGTDHPVSGHWN